MFDFEMLDLPAHLKTRLKELNFSEPTPIQNKAIPLALAGHDILGLAQTGTGKTLAFGLPLLNHVLNAPGKPEPKVAKSLILAPTRELVNQIAESLKQFTIGTKVRVMTVVGGQSINKQIQLLGRGTDILVATPGRLIDLLDRRAVTLKQAHYLVLDEADKCWIWALFMPYAALPPNWAHRVKPCCFLQRCRKKWKSCPAHT
jgi:ATP-dependent RNA helicase RhlE